MAILSFSLTTPVGLSSDTNECIEITNSGNILVGGWANGNKYRARSTDNCSSWSTYNTPSSPAVNYAGDFLIDGTDNAGRISKSTDDGISFGTPVDPDGMQLGHKLIKGSDDYIYCFGRVYPGQTYTGIVRSLNGITWQEGNTSTYTDFKTGIELNSIFYGGGIHNTTTKPTAWKSSNGVDWTEIKTGLPTVNNTGINSFVIHKNSLYATIYGDSSSKEIYKLNTGTDTWSLYSSFPEIGITIKLYSFAGYMWALQNGINGSIFISFNDGKNWINVSDALGYCNDMLYKESNNTIFVNANGISDGGRVYKATLDDLNLIEPKGIICTPGIEKNTLTWNSYTKETFDDLDNWTYSDKGNGETATIISGIVRLDIPDGVDGAPNIKNDISISVENYDLQLDIVNIVPDSVSDGLSIFFRMVDNSLDNQIYANYGTWDKRFRIIYKINGGSTIFGDITTLSADPTKLRILKKGTIFTVGAYVSGSWILVDSINFGSYSNDPIYPNIHIADRNTRGGYVDFDNLQDVLQKNIYWSLASGVTKATGTKIASISHPYEHISLDPWIPVYYIMTNEDDYEESDDSNEINGTPY